MIVLNPMCEGDSVSSSLRAALELKGQKDEHDESPPPLARGRRRRLIGGFLRRFTFSSAPLCLSRLSYRISLGHRTRSLRGRWYAH